MKSDMDTGAWRTGPALEKRSDTAARRDGCAAGRGTARRTALLALALSGLGTAGQAEDARAFVGATLTTDYMLNALSQTQGGPAFQPYIEVEFPHGFYIGAWMSNVDFGDGTDSVETDLYVGLRGETRYFDYDITLFRYYYDETGYCCSEFVVSATYPIFGPLTGTTAYHSFLNGNHAVEAGLGLALAESTDVSGTYKTDGIGEAWTVGLSRQLSETVRADLRYHDASYTDGTIVLSLNWDAEWASLFGER